MARGLARERFRRHRGHAGVIRQELASEKGSSPAFGRWSGQ